MSSTKALTILIPVYNGARFIGGLLDSFASFIEADPLGPKFLSDCELLVINNRSEDATPDIVRSFCRRIPNLRVVTPDTHVPSAEENVFRAFSLAQGEYTWVLGCDDIVRFETFPHVLQIAQDGAYDIAIFNFMQSDERGRIESVCNYYMREPVYEGDLVSFTQRTGFWWLIAGFSGQIVRTALVSGYDHAALVAKTSPIYSHVTAYLECLAGRPAAIVNIQNVIYRLSDQDVAHWRRAAERLGVFDEFFWTLGYVRQIKYLENRKIVGRDYLIQMVERTRSSFFRPTAMIYDKILSQLQIMATSRDPRNRLTPAEFEELNEFFECRDLLARPLLSALRTIFNSLTSNKRVDRFAFDHARKLLQGYQSGFLLAPNFAGIEGDYEIYRLANVHYGVHRLFRGALLERLRYLDHVEQPPVVFAGRTWADVTKRVQEKGVGLDLGSVPSPLMRFCSQSIAQGAQAWPASRTTREGMCVVANTDSASSFETGPALRAAQSTLRDVYKASNSYLARLTAWCTVLGIKLVRRLLGSSYRQLPGNAAISSSLAE